MFVMVSVLTAYVCVFVVINDPVLLISALETELIDKNSFFFKMLQRATETCT